jgi:hypothetical protein
MTGRRATTEFDVSAARLIRLRYPTRCSVCGTHLPPRSEARWDKSARVATCRACVEGRGTPGASAARENQRRRERREQRARDRFGRLGGVYLALTDEPQATKSWERGSQGERALGRYLETLHDSESIVVLHDRRIPGTRANVDHIAIAPTGVHVIDAKNYSGKVERVDVGGLLSTEWQLRVGGRDCTNLVNGLHKQVAAVRSSLAGELDVEVHAVMCFTCAEWSLFARPFEVGGVWIGWAKALGKRLQAPGPLDPDAAQLVAQRLAAALPCA